MNKNQFIFCLMLCVCISLNAQVPSYEWIKRAGANGNDAAESVTTDQAGNIIVIGQYSNATLRFDSDSLEGNTASFFMVKYDPLGNLIWLKTAGGHCHTGGNSVRVDLQGDILVAGNFYGSSIQFDSILLYNSGSWDGFLVKYDPAGNVLWAKKAGSNDHDNFYGLITDKDGNIAVTGRFKSPEIKFDSITLTNAGSGTGAFDVFIAKYDPDGTIVWAKSFGGVKEDGGDAIGLDSEGNIVVAGIFADIQINFDSITLLNFGWKDIYIVKLDLSGNVLWAKNAGGSGFEYVQSLTIDRHDNILMTGYFGSPSINFDSITLLNSTFVYDVYLVKYDDTGKALWAAKANGSSLDAGSSVATDKNDNIFIAGSFSSESISFGATTLTNGGGWDIFLAKYGPSGNNVWAMGGSGGIDYDETFCVSVDKDDNIFIAGGFWSDTCYFGSDTIINSDVDDIQSQDLFFAKISDLKTGADDHPKNQTSPQWTVYPNPGQDQFSITCTERIDDVFISDLSGHTIMRASPESDSYFFEMEKAGMYIIILSSKGSRSAKKLLVIR